MKSLYAILANPVKVDFGRDAAKGASQFLGGGDAAVGIPKEGVTKFVFANHQSIGKNADSHFSSFAADVQNGPPSKADERQCCCGFLRLCFYPFETDLLLGTLALSFLGGALSRKQKDLLRISEHPLTANNRPEIEPKAVFPAAFPHKPIPIN